MTLHVSSESRPVVCRRIVVLCTDREHNGPDLKLLSELSALNLSTPISYGGGIRDAKDALNAMQVLSVSFSIRS